MATAHLSVKVGKAGKGTPHAEYISRTGKYAKKLEQGEKLEATESGNMPAWAEENPLTFWQAADQYERANGTVYREHEIALPRELTAEQRAELVREWVHHELGDRHAYTWAIHNKTALDGKPQPHVHLMYSERMNDGIERDPEQYFRRYNPKYPERGGAKKHRSGETPTERKAALTAQRERWEKLHNAHIDRHLPKTTLLEASRNHRAKISMKSLAEQGIDRQTAPKMTPSESAAMHRKAAAERAADKAAQAVFEERQQKEKQQQELAEAAAREREKQRQEAEKEKIRQGLAKLPTEKLIAKYEKMAEIGSSKQIAERETAQGYWYQGQRYQSQVTTERIAELHHENNIIMRRYNEERQRRENSFFGLGAIGTKLQKENALQQQMHDAYRVRSREISELEKQEQERQQKYAARLKKESAAFQTAASNAARELEAEIARRPLSEFKTPYEQAKQNSTTRAAKTAAERLEANRERLNPIQEKIAYFKGAAELERVEKTARPIEQKQEYRKNHGRGKDNEQGYSR